MKLSGPGKAAKKTFVAARQRCAGSGKRIPASSVELQEEADSAGGIRARLADATAQNDELKVTIAELREEVRQYAEQFNWQYTASAGSNAEARAPEVKAQKRLIGLM